MLKEKCATALSTATCLWQEKTRITPQSPVTFYTRVRRVGEPNQAPSAPERLASTCFECAAATQQSSCWVLWEPPLPLLNILGSWKGPHLQHSAWWQQGLDLGVFTYKSDGYPTFPSSLWWSFLPRAGTNADTQPAVCSRKRWGAAAATQRPQAPWDTSKLGFMQRRNCNAAAPASTFPSPSALGKGGMKKCWRAMPPFRKHFLAPQPQHQVMALCMGHVWTRDTMAVRGSTSHSHSCGPAGLR